MQSDQDRIQQARQMSVMDSTGKQSADDRQRVAEMVRHHADAITRSGLQGLGYWLRMPDIGPDRLSEWVGDGFRRLAADLAFAIEMDQPGLLTDNVRWLVQMMQARGYDAEQIAQMTLETFEASLAAVCPAEVLVWAAPLLAEARLAVAQTAAELRASEDP
jgi:hypothetical protein